jgi:hypothetical protein
MAIAVSACAGPISFSGQFDPSLATVQTNGGNGGFDASGAPVSVTLWGSDSDQGTQIITLVTWNITTPESNLWFRWFYEDLGRRRTLLRSCRLLPERLLCAVDQRFRTELPTRLGHYPVIVAR